MKVITIIYHKNINNIYKKEWIDKCYNSILNQTHSDFIIYELNYGDDDLQLCNYLDGKEYKYYKIPFENHAEAMNFLLEKCFIDGADFVFNNNLDDINDLNRFEIQLNAMNNGYEIVSSNFTHIDSEDNELENMNMSNFNLNDEFSKGHNIICHPSVCYSRKFIENNKYIPSEIPEEDFNLWKRTLNDYNFFICPEFLIKYRKHENQITSSNLKEKNINYFNQNLYNNIEICNCGLTKNKIKYNFCQKCNKLY